MNKEQQIKELAEKLKQCGYPDAEADPKVIASRVINSGYRKQADVAREFAEKVLKEINDAINHNNRIMESSSDTNLATYNNAIITNNACKGIYDAVSIIAKEYGVEVEQ